MSKNETGKYTVTLSDKSLLSADALLLTTGFRLFDAHRKEEYGYGIYNHVITSVELENLFTNHSLTLADGKKPQRIGFIHCVGSRDEKVCNYHCSKLCCITAVKQAIKHGSYCRMPKFSVFTWTCVCLVPAMKNYTAMHKKNTTSNLSGAACPKLLKT